MKKAALLLVPLFVLAVCGAYAAGSVFQQTPDISAYDHYLTVADVEKVSGLTGVTRSSGISPENMGPIVAIDNKGTDEQLLMAGIPYDARKSPADLAAGFVALLKESNPNLQAFNWQTEPKTADCLVLFELSDQTDGIQYRGAGYVVKTANDAHWFSYVAPAAGFSKARCPALLEGFITSLASGAASKAPAVDYTADPDANGAKLDRNAQAFVFVLEFALGAPFTQAQERVILDELMSGWRTMSPAELKQYDQYPVLVQSILKLGQKDLETLRAGLEKTIREWLAETGQADPAVKIIRAQLQIRGRVVVAGDPPLTEMALAAYSEVIAFSRLLRQKPGASPDRIAPEAVSGVRKQVLQAWPAFSREERQSIAASPGLWICLRVLLREGTQAEKDKIRGQLLKLSPANSGGSGSGAGSQKPMDLTTHSVLMNMQQTTFNTYMWSRGFNYSTYGRMW